jgi:hypothetical protein
MIEPCTNQLCECKWFIATCPQRTTDAPFEIAVATICFGNAVVKAL